MPRPRRPENIPRIEILDTLGEGPRTIVYRGHRDRQMLAVKMPRSREGRPTPDENERFFRRALWFASVGHPSLVPLIEVGRSEQGVAYAAFPLVEGQSLARLYHQGPQDEGKVRVIAQALAGALSSVHARGLVHGGVWPQNVVLVEGGGVQLLDPDLLGPRPGSEPQGFGSLMYDAPERLGLAEFPIEPSTDLYALGAVLYHAVTGRAPFRAAHPSELMRQRREEKPPPSRKLVPGLSQTFGEILDRLIAEDADERYRSAKSLLFDLEDLDAARISGERGPRFPIDSVLPSPLGIEPVPLIDRAGELNGLLEDLNRAAAGLGAIHIMEGDAGTGKSRLAQELAHAAATKRATVLRADCRRDENIPFSELRRALDGCLCPPNPEADCWAHRESLLEAGAGLESYLIHFHPRLADIFSERTALPLVPGRNQIESSVAEMMLRLAAIAGPLVVIIEDFQWISNSSARVLSQIAQGMGKSGLLLLLTGQSPEIHSGAGLALQKRLRAKLPRRSHLGPLGEPSARAFVQSMLGSTSCSRTILDSIVGTSKGNPLRLREHVNCLLDSSLIAPMDGAWHELEDGAARRIGELGLEGMVARRQSLISSEARDLLKLASCGSHFCFDELAPSLDYSRSRAALALSELIQTALVIHVPRLGYAVSHELIREIVDRDLDPAERRRLHLRMAESVSRDGSSHRSLAGLTAAAHYARAGEDGSSPRTLSAYFSAGCAALRARTYDEALPHFDRALDTLRRSGRPHRALELVLRESLAEACYQTGKIDLARGHLEALFLLEPNPMQRARAHGRLADMYMMELRSAPAWAEIEKGLSALGKPLRGRASMAARAAVAASLGRLMVMTGIGVGRGSNLRRRHDRLLVSLQLRAAQIGYLSLRPDRLAQMRLFATLPAARLGPSAEQVAVLAHQSLLLSSLGRRCTRRRLDEAERMALALADPAASAGVTALRARSASQLGDSREAERLAKVALYDLGRWLDTREYVLTAADHFWSLTVRGKTLEAWEVIRRVFMEAVPGDGKRPMPMNLLPETAAMACLSVLGRSRAARHHLERAEARLSDEVESFWRMAHLTGKLLMHREQRELGRGADDAIDSFEGFGVRPGRLPLHLRLFLVVQAYVRVDQGEAHGPNGKGHRHHQLRRAVRALRRAADVPLLRAHSLVASAALLRLQGRTRRARALLDRAEAMGDNLDAPWVTYEALCERARLLLSEANPTAARRAAFSALELARQQGWKPRARRVRAEFALVPGKYSTRGAVPQESHFARALEMTLFASHSPSPAAQTRLVLEWLLRLFGGERAYLLHRDETTDGFVLVAGRDLRGNDLDQVEPETIEICRRAAVSRKPVLAQESPSPEGSRRNGLKSKGRALPLRALAAPLMRGRQVAGVLYVDHHMGEILFSAQDMEILAAIASHVPMVLELTDEARLEIYERIAANVPGLVFQFVSYPDGRRSYRYVSDNVRALGVSPVEARRDAETLIRRIHPEDLPSFEKSLARSAETLRPWHWEGRYLLPDGSFRWFHGAARPEPQPGGAILWDGLTVDINRLKAAEARIRHLNAELEGRVADRTRELVLANQELEAFTYSVSHDLRTPLMSIQGFAEELVTMMPPGDEARDFLDRILTASKRMEILIEAMLSLSRIAHQPLARKRVNLSEMAAEVWDALKRREPTRKVVLTVEPDMVCEADETLIRIVLENLIGNAWKFTRHREVAHIRFGRRLREGQTVFTLEDDGAGFDMSLADQLFQPFTRLHGAGEFEGSGVGLATVRRVVQRHGGRVWAESRPDAGAAFHFTLETETSDRAPTNGGRPSPRP